MADKRSTLESDAETDSTAQARGRARALAEQQGVKPIRDIRDLRGDFWPHDEPAEDFLAWLRSIRREESVRSVPE